MDAPWPEDPSDHLPPPPEVGPSGGPPVPVDPGGQGALDPDDEDRSSGACGCMVAGVVLLIIVLTAYACATQREGSSTCAAAWEDVAAAGPSVVGSDVYRPTLLTCTTVAEWDAENIAHGARAATGAAAIDELCRTLNVSSDLCTAADQASGP